MYDSRGSNPHLLYKRERINVGGATHQTQRLVLFLRNPGDVHGHGLANTFTEVVRVDTHDAECNVPWTGVVEAAPDESASAFVVGRDVTPRSEVLIDVEEDSGVMRVAPKIVSRPPLFRIPTVE